MPNKELRKERAQMFQPFDALKGFKEYIQQKERVIVERKQLSEDDCEELNRKLQYVQVGKMLKIIYYDIDEYVELEGMVSKVDLEYTKTITIVNKKIGIYNLICIDEP